MAHTAQRAHIDPERLRSIQAALAARDLDGWLLYDYHATNPIAGRVLGLHQPLSRRYFALLPVEGKPVVLAHKIETAPWADWPGPVRTYFAWEEMEAALAELLNPGQHIALEYSEDDAIPQVDRVPAGVLDLVKRAGVHTAESGELATLFASAWTETELDSHRRSAATCARAAARGFKQAAEAIKAGRILSEWELKSFIVDALADGGLVDVDSIVGVGPNSADGHYEPTAHNAAPIEPEKVLLIDLWGREPGSVFADQTWMGFTGTAVPEQVQRVWHIVREARDTAVAHITDHAGDPQLRACDVDVAARGVIQKAGYADQFTHRTGHSIDAELHGLGPNIDSIETRDSRTLLPGIGFSIEPGVYLEGEFGIRSEINVYMDTTGPEVTTPGIQNEIYALLSEGWESTSNL